jgi:hypothetical protein
MRRRGWYGFVLESGFDTTALHEIAARGHGAPASVLACLCFEAEHSHTDEGTGVRRVAIIFVFSHRSVFVFVAVVLAALRGAGSRRADTPRPRFGGDACRALKTLYSKRQSTLRSGSVGRERSPTRREAAHHTPCAPSNAGWRTRSDDFEQERGHACWRGWDHPRNTRRAQQAGACDRGFQR